MSAELDTLKVLHSDFGVTTQNGFIKSFAANEIEENITTLYLNSEKDLEIPEKHSNNDIDRKILRPAQERIKESGSDVWFDYELICKYPIKGRKPKADTIIFTINTLHPREAGGEQFEQYSFVYRWVSNAMNNPTDDKAQKAVDKISDLGRLKEVYERCCYYDDRVCSGVQSRIHAQNALLKMLREEFKIK